MEVAVKNKALVVPHLDSMLEAVHDFECVGVGDVEVGLYR